MRMATNRGPAIVATLLVLLARGLLAQTCHDTPPPRVWIVDAPYPLQAGAERT